VGDTDPAPPSRSHWRFGLSNRWGTFRRLGMAALQSLPQWRRVVFLLPVMVLMLILATGLYNGSIPKPTL
jgi:hypothetical protein